MTMTAPVPSAGAAPDHAPADDLKLRLTPEERRQRMLVGVYLGLAAFVFVFFALDPDSASDATFNLSMPQDRFSLSWTFEPRLVAIIVSVSLVVLAVLQLTSANEPEDDPGHRKRQHHHSEQQIGEEFTVVGVLSAHRACHRQRGQGDEHHRDQDGHVGSESHSILHDASAMRTSA